MSRSLYLLLLLLAGVFGISQAAFAQTWQLAGPTQEASSPYDLYYYKLLQVNQTSHRYASIIDVSIQGDANYYYMQGTYRIRVDKLENTSRFDGLEIQCISLTTMCSSQSNEEKLKATAQEAVSALQTGNTKAFIALIGFSDLDKINKTEEMVDFDVKKIQRLFSVHYANKPLQPEFPDLYNNLGKRVVRIPIYDQTQDNPRVKEMHLNLYFGPPNFVPLNRLSGYALITNNADSLEFRPLSYWKDKKVAY